MMRSEWRLAALAGVLMLVLYGYGCNGHGAENFSDNESPNPSESPGPSGPPALIEFVAPTGDSSPSDGSTVFQSSIGPLGSSNPQGSFVQFRVLNADGRPAKNGLRVTFSVEGPSDATLSLTSDKTQSGFVSTTLRAGPTSGNAVVVARVDGTNLVARSPVIFIGLAGGPAVALEFFASGYRDCSATSTTTPARRRRGRSSASVDRGSRRPWTSCSRCSTITAAPPSTARSSTSASSVRTAASRSRPPRPRA